MYNGENGTPLIRFNDPDREPEFEAIRSKCARIYRQNIGYDESVMVTGDYYQDKMTFDEARLSINHSKNNCEIIEDFKGMYDRFNSTIKEGCFLGVREDHNFYSSSRKKHSASKCGKLLLVDKTDVNVHHIFFDDNINKDENCCVDVWDVRNKKRIPIEESYDKFMYEVDTLEAISDPDYFIKAFDKCIANRKADTSHLQRKGLKTIEKDYLQTCPPSEYLASTVMPLLKTAFEILDKEEPEDPINFLAVYLMENKEKAGCYKKDNAS